MESKTSGESESNNLVDMLLSKNKEKTLDSDTMILETQKRVWGALKRGYEYTGMIDESDQFLRKNVFSKHYLPLKVNWKNHG